MNKIVRMISFLTIHNIPSVLYIVIATTISKIYDLSKIYAVIIAFVFKNMLLVYFILNMIIMLFSHKLLNYEKTKHYYLKIAATYVAVSLYSYAMLWIIGFIIRIIYYV